MAEEDITNLDDEDQAKPPAFPVREALPPPPDVSFQRPLLRPPPGRSAAEKPQSSAQQKENQAQLSQGVQGYGLAITAAISLALTLLLFIGLGQWLDHRFHPGGTPWFTIVGLLLGVVGGFGTMIRLLASAGKK